VKGLVYETSPALPPGSGWRNDLVCFIGQVAVRDAEPPADLTAWLRAQGWRRCTPSSPRADASAM